MTIEERTYHDALMDIMRNRHVLPLEAARVLELIGSVHSSLTSGNGYDVAYESSGRHHLVG